MQVFTVLMQTPLILLFSRPQPSFDLLYALAHFPYIAIFYFSNCISYFENINLVWPFLVKELIKLSLCHPALASIWLSKVTNAPVIFWVSHGVLGHLFHTMTVPAVLLDVESLEWALPVYFRLWFWCWNNGDPGSSGVAEWAATEAAICSVLHVFLDR